MGFTKVALGFLVLFGIFSCSKQESTNADSPDQSAETAEQSYTPPADAKPVKLTPEEIEKAAWQVFINLHSMAIYDESVVGYKEDFAMTGDRITYKVLRHNVDKAGWQVSETQVATYAGSQNDGSAEDGSSDDTGTEGEEPASETPSYYNRRDAQYYNNEIDTLSIDVPYVAYLERGEPESAAKTVRIVLHGGLRFENNKDVETDETLVHAPFDLPVVDVVVDFSNTISVGAGELYLKAKIANLTDQDLAGLSKDELGYARNEIFARHGHTFKTQKMANHFNPMEWYHMVIDDAAPLLNKFEKRNVEFIKKKEG